MNPLLHPGDRIFVDESPQARTDLNDGDVVVFRHGDQILIKRILGLPGETISGKDRKVFRNGKEVSEPYLAPPIKEQSPALTSFAPRKVNPAEVFVLGDDRDRSLDSREAEYGAVREADILGKYSFTYWHAGG